MKVNQKPYYHRSSIENTLAQMPRYNAYACGYGKHKSRKIPTAKPQNINQKRNQIEQKEKKNFERS